MNKDVTSNLDSFNINNNKHLHYSKRIITKIAFLTKALLFLILLTIVLIGIIVYYQQAYKHQLGQALLLSNQLNEFQAYSMTKTNSLYQEIAQLKQNNQMLRDQQSKSELNTSVKPIGSLLDNKDIVFINSFFPYKAFKLISMYQASKDGDSQSNFKKSLDGISQLLFVIETTKGLKIGGYTRKLCEEHYSEQNMNEFDPDAFLFSITNQQQYKVKNPLVARLCHEDYLIAFDTDLMIRTNCLDVNASSSFPHNYNNLADNAKDKELTKKDGVFFIKDLEVFRVTFY